LWPVIGKLDQATATDLIRTSIDRGINFFDTADVYSEGESERILGRGLKDLSIARKDVVIATKVRGRMSPGPNAVGLSRGHITDAIKESLQRLGTDYIDLYQIHGADPQTPIDETLRALDDLVRSGQVRYIGCSNLMAWQIMKALGISSGERWARFQTVNSIASRDIEREIVPLINAEHTGLMVWSPLAGGLLSGKFRRDSADPNDTRRASFDFPPVEREHAYAIVEALDPIARKYDVSVASGDQRGVNRCHTPSSAERMVAGMKWISAIRRCELKFMRARRPSKFSWKRITRHTRKNDDASQ
jgi:aryl-alcohol dehydrogenase-like predicted oxidoreductase